MGNRREYSRKQKIRIPLFSKKTENYTVLDKESHKKNFKSYKGVKIFLLVVFIGFVIFLSAIFFILFNNPSIKLIYGTYKALHEPNPEFTLEVSIEKTAKKYDVLEGFDIKISASMSEMNLSSHGEVNYDTKNLAEVTLVYKDENLFIDLGSLYEPVLYSGAVDNNRWIEPLVLMKGYLKNIELNGVKWFKYLRIIDNEMKNNIVKDKKDILLTLNLKDLSRMFEKLLDEAAFDKDLKESLKKSLRIMLEDMIEDDFKFSSFEKSDFVDLIGTLDEDFDKIYDDMVGHGRRIFQYNGDNDHGLNISDLENGPLDGQTFRFSFDFYKLTGIEAVFDGKEIEISTNLKLVDDQRYQTYQVVTSNHLNDYDLKDVGYLISEIGKNLMNNINNNNSLVEKLKKTSKSKMLSLGLNFEDSSKWFKILENKSIRRLIYRLIFK